MFEPRPVVINGITFSDKTAAGNVTVSEEQVREAIQKDEKSARVFNGLPPEYQNRFITEVVKRQNESILSGGLGRTAMTTGGASALGAGLGYLFGDGQGAAIGGILGAIVGFLAEHFGVATDYLYKPIMAATLRGSLPQQLEAMEKERVSRAEAEKAQDAAVTEGNATAEKAPEAAPAPGTPAAAAIVNKKRYDLNAVPEAAKDVPGASSTSAASPAPADTTPEGIGITPPAAADALENYGEVPVSTRAPAGAGAPITTGAELPRKPFTPPGMSIEEQVAAGPRFGASPQNVLETAALKIQNKQQLSPNEAHEVQQARARGWDPGNAVSGMNRRNTEYQQALGDPTREAPDMSRPTQPDAPASAPSIGNPIDMLDSRPEVGTGFDLDLPDPVKGPAPRRTAPRPTNPLLD